MNITEYLGLSAGHANLDFVDVRTDTDTELFIDPCLIELGSDKRSQQACRLFDDFADTLFNEMRSNRWACTNLLDDAHEIHDTKLGYGNGRNGKGKTAEGLNECFYGLQRLANGFPTISQIQDLSIFVQDFAEDSMSDLLTNILHRILCEFTQEQMAKYGKEPAGLHPVRYWNSEYHRWEETSEPYWLCDGCPILLVPKEWVRKSFLFNAHQYLFSIIIARMQDTPEYSGLSRKDIWNSLARTTAHWEYDRVTRQTAESPDLLSEYHDRMLSFYKRKGGIMTDDDLDEAVYHCMFLDDAS